MEIGDYVVTTDKSWCSGKLGRIIEIAKGERPWYPVKVRFGDYSKWLTESEVKVITEKEAITREI